MTTTQENQTVQDVNTTTQKEVAHHLDNNVIIAAALGITQLCARNLGLAGITTTLADPLQEDPVKIQQLISNQRQQQITQ